VATSELAAVQEPALSLPSLLFNSLLEPDEADGDTANSIYWKKIKTMQYWMEMIPRLTTNDDFIIDLFCSSTPIYIRSKFSIN